MNATPPEIGRKSRQFLGPGEIVLGLALLFLLGTFVLIAAVMGWILAFFTFPLALLLLAIGIALERNPSTSANRQVLGFGLLFLGMALLGVAAFAGTIISVQQTFDAHHQALPFEAGKVLFVGSLLAVFLIGSGLRLWTDWSRSRRFGWCMIILLFPSATLFVHRFLAEMGLVATGA